MEFVECHNTSYDGKGGGGAAIATTIFHDNYYKIESPRYVFQITDYITANGNDSELCDDGEKNDVEKEYFELKPAVSQHNLRRIGGGGCYDDIDEFLIEELISEKNILDYEHEVESSTDENSIDDVYFDYYGPIITVESVNYINGIIMQTSNNLEIDGEQNSDVYPFQCTSCKSGFKTSYDLITHFEDQHKNVHLNYIHCIICDEAFSTAEAMKDHMQIHKDVVKRPYSCKDCGKRFKTYEYCRNHEDNQMCNASDFVCKACGKEFPNNYGLVRHGVVHTNERPLKCTLCPKRFRNPTNLQFHMRWHQGERPFYCNICHKTFGNRQHLDRHRKNHNEKFKFSCKICERAFSVKEELDQHMQVHLSKRRYECPICGKKFLREEKLKRHLMFHTSSDENIKCRLCEKEFTAMRYLLRHMTMTHQMKILTTLSTHFKPESEKTLTPKEKKPRKPYNSSIKGNFCEHCNTTFKTPRYLGKHRKIVHPDIYPNSDVEFGDTSNSNSLNDSSQLDDSLLLDDSLQIEESSTQY